MGDITQLLCAMENEDAAAKENLLSLVYDELRAIAAQKMAGERPGSTLQATALVHEAYLRLLGGEQGQRWDHRGHFFSAAAESMRRILVEVARSKSRQKREGDRSRKVLNESSLVAPARSEQVLAVHEALEILEQSNPMAAKLVDLRFFAGFTNRESAGILDISPRKADQLWAYARVWLAAQIGEVDMPDQ